MHIELLSSLVYILLKKFRLNNLLLIKINSNYISNQFNFDSRVCILRKNYNYNKYTSTRLRL